jgi:hypothetical protein
MSTPSLFVLILQALIALPKIGSLIEGWIARFKAWKHDQDLAEVQKKIAEAKAATIAAQTPEERLNAAQKWQEALKKPRPADPAQ